MHFLRSQPEIENHADGRHNGDDRDGVHGDLPEVVPEVVLAVAAVRVLGLLGPPRVLQPRPVAPAGLAALHCGRQAE